VTGNSAWDETRVDNCRLRDTPAELVSAGVFYMLYSPHMSLPTRTEAETLLRTYTTDPYLLHHAAMVGAATASYAAVFGEDEHLYWLTGYLHDIDYEQHPNEHPGPSLTWFTSWDYPADLIHAVEAHADGFNGYTTKPASNLARALLACDEICGIFYAYQKLNPIPYGDMKVSSIVKRLREEKFAPGISRPHIYAAVDGLGVTPESHIERLITALATLDPK
jgi:putative nucleotidyltransferase with HDIG domain